MMTSNKENYSENNYLQDLLSEIADFFGNEKREQTIEYTTELTGKASINFNMVFMHNMSSEYGNIGFLYNFV